MVEEWKDIVIEKNGVIYDFTGKYQVSNLGNVRSLNYKGNVGKIGILKPKRSKNGYLFVSLFVNGKEKKQKNYYIHRLVATAFILNDDPNKTEVNHIDENSQNNHYSNLEWVTPKENSNHGTRTERAIKHRKKRVICVENGQVFDSIADVERKTGLSNSSISGCCRGKYYKTVGGYHWQYYNDYLIEQLIVN